MAKKIQHTVDLNNYVQDIKDVKIFGGEYDGLQRTDRYKYEITKKLFRALEGATWFPREIDFTKDKITVASFEDVDVEMYRSTIIFQNFADSVANRYLDNVLCKHVSSPEWEALFKIQGYQELNHSGAYSHNIREVYSDTEAFFSEGLQDKYIIDRLKAEVSVYEKLGDLAKIETDKDKKLLIVSIFHQYALESIRFQVSFLIGFLIDDKYDHGLQGTVNNNKLILNDEFSHTVIFANLIRILSKVKDEGFVDIIKEVDIVPIFKDVVESEIEWFKYLTRNGALAGATLNDITGFLHHLAGKALKFIKVDNDFEINPQHRLVKFFTDNSKLNDAKSLGQETNTLAYNIGILIKSSLEVKVLAEEIDNFMDAL